MRNQNQEINADERLYAAVIRGDVNAVQAALHDGANPNLICKPYTKTDKALRIGVVVTFGTITRLPIMIWEALCLNL